MKLTLAKIRQIFGLLLRRGRLVYLKIVGRGKVEIGPENKISLGAWIDLSGGKIKTGRNCVVARGSVILAHDGAQRWCGNPEKYYKETILGDNVFVGMNVTILPGVTIGNDVVIGAGSVVTRDIPDGSIVCGNPANIIRRDFSYNFKR